MHCYRHPGEETTLRCSKCERPICTKCAVLTTVGYRCPECGRERSTTRDVPLPSLALGLVLGAGLGAGVGFLAAKIVGFLLLLVSPFVGRALGELLFRSMGRRSSPLVGGVTAVATVLGSLLGPIQAAIGRLGSDSGAGILAGTNVWAVAFAAIAGGLAWQRLV
ncbi:MAG: hypothetical protein D6724_11275 [Armatimonadetes bacterium]|nr:MAG: hypothetical protein D6724_11275 [Armatimonadota bacterium]